MGEEQVDVEYISLHACVRNTFIAESWQESLITGKEYTDPCKTWQDERRKGKEDESEQDWACTREVGEIERGEVPTLKPLFGTKGKHFSLLDSATDDLCQSEWSEKQ